MNEIQLKYFDPLAYDKLAKLEGANWWFRSRNKFIIHALEQFKPNLGKFLEIGCGTGFVLEAISRKYPYSEIFGTEFFEQGLYYARKRVTKATFSQLDATSMAEDGIYDGIGAFDVLEHIEDDVKVLENLSRALNECGMLFITVPQHRWLWSATDEYACHVRRYSRSELVLKVSLAGLNVKYVTSFVTLLLPLMWLSRLMKKNKSIDPLGEFKISKLLNYCLEFVMKIEYLIIKIGVKLPVGGSILLVAEKS